MTNLLSVSVSDGIATVIIENPPVNAFSSIVRKALWEAIEDIESRDDVKAAVIGSKGRLFSAGADIREFDAPVIEPGLPGLIDHVEACSKPVVVALFGTTLGGGFELSMGCHYRVAQRGGVVGLPELNLGIIPGAGGTQRLPRLIGFEPALAAILEGRHIPVEEAHELGAIDELTDGDPIPVAQAAAARLAAQGFSRTGDRTVAKPEGFEELIASTKSQVAKRKRGFDAPPAAVEAVAWSVTEPFAEGLKKEKALSMELKASTQSKAQRHLFFGERTAFKIPGVTKDEPLLDLKNAGVIGAGTMGAGIAVCLLKAGLSVTLVDANQDALDAGVGRIRKIYDRDVERSRLTAQERDDILSRLTASTSLDGVADADVVIEAVFENFDLKASIFADLDRITKKTAILATNTSTLDINALAATISAPDRVIGTHFFSPAHIMRLLEVVRGDKTAPGVIATTMDLGKRMGKVPALSGVGFGFIGNRMLEDYVRESQMLLLEGATPAQVDGVLEAWGMAMGPCAVMDLAGQDVSFLTRDQNRQHLPDDPTYYSPGDLMNELGRYGQKTGKGFYAYPDGRTREEDAEAIALIRNKADALGVEQRSDISEDEILTRCLYPLINRGAQLLDDGIALRASDINVIWCAGYGFPAYRGGPMFYGDTIGLAEVVKTFEQFAGQFGNTYGYWTPAPLLVKLAADGLTFADHDREKS